MEALITRVGRPVVMHWQAECVQGFGTAFRMREVVQTVQIAVHVYAGLVGMRARWR